MSSGNPFRASLSLPHAPPSPVPQAALSIADHTSETREHVLEDAASSPLRTKKHVRIESSTISIPPHPDVDNAYGAHQDAFAPSPSASNSVRSSLAVRSAGLPNRNMSADVYSAGAARGYGMAAHDAWAGSRTGPGTSQPVAYTSAVPANPFSRTLATLEPQEQVNGAGRTTAERAIQTNNRASLDVESFKNLLLTGRPSPRSSGQSSQINTTSSILSAPIFESSSSTDTSSISRQSLFDHTHEAHAESPRTSYEMAASDEDERAGLASEVKKGRRKPPPAPKPRHGKPVAPRQPQVVSFEDFSANEPVPVPVSRQNSSEINKPLPPTPIASAPSLHIDTQSSTQNQPVPVELKISDTPSTSDVLQSQKRAPPPVPLARRQSQLRTTGTSNRQRSSSNITTSSQMSFDAILPSPTPSSIDPMSNIKSPPPPPPHRHGARLAGIGTSSANSSNTELPQRSTSTRTVASSQEPSLSRRSTIESNSPPRVPGVNRTSSISSTRNPHRTISGESAGSAVQSPPPLPPPRRRQSARSSLDQQRPPYPPPSPTESRRTSIENRRTSVASESSLRHTYVPADEKFPASEYALYSPREEAEIILGEDPKTEEERKDSNKILDDMEKFQREIDELRAKFTKAA